MVPCDSKPRALGLEVDVQGINHSPMQPPMSQPAALPGLRKMGHPKSIQATAKKSNFTVLTFYLWWWWGAGVYKDASAEIIQEGFLEEVGAWECFLKKGERQLGKI